jgi:hypothetical protein
MKLCNVVYKDSFQKHEKLVNTSYTKLDKIINERLKLIDACKEFKDSEAAANTLKAEISSLESENAELKKHLSNCKFESILLESKMKAHEHTRRKLETVLIDSEKEHDCFLNRIRRKEQEVAQYEEDNAKYRHSLSDKEDEILQLKSHYGSLLESGSFTEVNRKKPTVETSTVGTTPGQETYSKPRLLLIGTSNLRKVDTDKWNTSYLSTKNTAFSIEEALPVVEQLSYVPQAIILHVLTNDIIKYDAQTCVSNMESLVSIVKTKCTTSKIVISLATPRNDNEEFNDKCGLVNIMMKQKFRNEENAIISDNSNLSFKGSPKSKYLERIFCVDYWQCKVFCLDTHSNNMRRA